MKTLTISSPFYDPGKQSTLLTEQNWQELCDTPGDFHTSLGDITSASLLDFCDCVDNIRFEDFGFESILDTRATTYMILNSLSHRFNINNYSKQLPITYLNHPMERPDAERVIWVFGCSYSHGSALEPTQKYSYHLQKHLGLPLVSVTQPGSSTRWSLRHLINANLKPNDIVVWQTSTFVRDSIMDDYNRDPVEIVFDDKNLYKAKMLSFEQMMFNHLSLIQYGVKYLRAKNQKFYMISIDSDEFREYLTRLLIEYNKYPEYCYTPDFIVDRAQDNQHPGPRSHEIVANRLLKKIHHG